MNIVDKKFSWLGRIVPKERSEIAQLYWTTNIPRDEIAEAYGIAGSAVYKTAGEGIVKHKIFTCRECNFLVKVASRSEAADKLNRFDERRSQGLRASRFICTWAEPDLCTNCSKRLRDAENQKHIERHRGQGHRQRELAIMPYREFLLTPEWQTTRKAALHRAKYSCQTCAGKGELHVHHRTYVRRGHEWASDLIVLCAPCHSLFHQNARLAEGGRAA